MRRALVAAALAATALLPMAGTAAASPQQATLLPITPAAAGSQAVPDEYVVRLKPGADPRAVTEARGLRANRVYERAVTGFAAKLTDAQLRALRQDRSVLGIEQNATMATALDTTQSNPPAWGVDRIDQDALPLSKSYTYNATGSGVNAYVIDTGIDVDHPEFGGRASWGTNTVDSDNRDCNSHGTHVAGTIGSKTYGVAKDVNLYAVKVMDCNGSSNLDALVAGVDWVTDNAAKPAVANMSWNWPASATLTAAVEKLSDSGVFVAASAGNTGADSCERSPRNASNITVVANSTSTDTRASTSSTGACVDLYAPGSSILSTVPGGKTGTKSGTSMAAPHVAGVAALYKDANGDVTTATLNTWFTEHAIPNAISGGTVGGTTNRLLNTDSL